MRVCTVNIFLIQEMECFGRGPGASGRLEPVRSEGKLQCPAWLYSRDGIQPQIAALFSGCNHHESRVSRNLPTVFNVRAALALSLCMTSFFSTFCLDEFHKVDK